MATNWGITSESGSSELGSAAGKLIGNTSPNLDNMVLDSVTIWMKANTAIRLIVYTGGDLDDPTDAAVLWDSGNQTSGNDGTGLYTFTADSSSIPKNTVLSIAYEAGASAGTRYLSSAAGDFQSARGWNTGVLDADPATAPPDPYASAGTFQTYWPIAYLTYSIAASSSAAAGNKYYYQHLMGA